MELEVGNGGKNHLGEWGWGVGEEGAQDKDDIHVKQVRMAGEAWLVAHQTSGAQVPGSNPAFPTMILMRCRIIV